ncbi:MAG TPA: class I SAM-dependent methyltransferase [Solirubrobacteraceae bacterium]|nr:class I SAM-dependent methyltransferase [Solirubrobacteraceae bacterium]
MARLSPGSGSVSGSFWDTRAERYDRHVRLAHTAGDPFLRRLLRLSDTSSSVLDVGAGTGRFALALAGAFGHVTVVEPSEAMLAFLTRRAEQLGVTNLTTIQARWEDADAEPADVVFSSFVLALVPEAVPFLAKLEAAARRRVLLYLGTFSADALLDPLWRHFHGAPRAPGASYLDARAVLREMGIEPAVKVVEIPNRKRFATIDDAVEHYRDALLVPDTPEVRDELAQLLGAWLFGRRGSLRAPLRATPAAILEWAPRPRG